MKRTLKIFLAILTTTAIALSMGVTAGAEEEPAETSAAVVVEETPVDTATTAEAAEEPVALTVAAHTHNYVIPYDDVEPWFYNDTLHARDIWHLLICDFPDCTATKLTGKSIDSYYHTMSSWRDLGHNSPTSPIHRWSRSCGVCGYTQNQTANCGTGGAHLAFSAPLPPLELESVDVSDLMMAFDAHADALDYGLFARGLGF